MTPPSSPPYPDAVSDAEAFHDLVKSHASMVFATARRVTGDAALAEDVAQETFLELSRQSHRAFDSVSAWLHRVAWRKACNAVRSESRRRRHEQTAVEASSVIEDASWQELEPLIDHALEELPSPLRELLVEHFLQNRTQQELAASRGTSQSTVSRQLETGLQEIRARLRSKGILCGTGFAALLGTHSAEAAPASLQASLGKLALSGVGAGTPGVPAASITASLFAMSLAKIIVSTAVVAGLVAIPFVLQHKEESSPAISKSPNPPSSKAANSNTTSTKAVKTTTTAPHYRPPPATEAVRLKVDAIIRRHRSMSREEMIKDAELKQLMDTFAATAKLDSPEMEKKMGDAIDALKESKGSEHGAINMDFGSVDSPEFRTWLEAALSNDTERAQDWILSRLQGAVFEFAVDPTKEKTSDGVRVLPDNAKSKGSKDGKKEEKMNF